MRCEIGQEVNVLCFWKLKLGKNKESFIHDVQHIGGRGVSRISGIIFNILEKILLFNNMGTLLIGVYPQTHTEYTLNIAGLPEGIYFLKILINNNYYSTIIIKQ